jgi:microcystin-dependent protein
MSQPFIGECRMVGFNFAPSGWLICQGQLAAIADYTALYTLIGTTYGGNGQSNFGIPNLQGRVPVHQGQGLVVGQYGGQETVALTIQQLAAHSHPLLASSSNGTSNNLQNSVLTGGPNVVYITNPAQPPPKAMKATALTNAGGSQPHDNLQPYLALNWVISLFGVFPSAS